MRGERLMDNVPFANSLFQDKPSPQLWENGSKFTLSFFWELVSVTATHMSKERTLCIAPDRSSDSFHWFITLLPATCCSVIRLELKAKIASEQKLIFGSILCYFSLTVACQSYWSVRGSTHELRPFWITHLFITHLWPLVWIKVKLDHVTQNVEDCFFIFVIWQPFYSWLLCC